MKPPISSPRRRAIRARLDRWYAKHARDLPWRRTRDPYRVWVSEIMLQQTLVSTVVGYFERFIERFPTVESLAAAPLDEVLRLWQGLGYYRRAANLHRAAREVCDRFAGRVPHDAESLRRLPGVGRYIAGAIQSIAFNERAPILEANTARVLCRLFAVRGDVKTAATQRRLWELSELLLPRLDAGMFNQAMMELGALVCVPGRPRCDECPLAATCDAQRAGLAERLPQTGPRKRFIDVEHAAIVLRRGGKLLIVQRSPHETWGGLWELPRTAVTRDADPRATIRAFVRKTLGLKITVGRKLLTLKHGVTHHRITLSCYETARVAGRLRPNGHADCRWEQLERLDDYAFSSPQRKLIAVIQRGQPVRSE